MLILPSDLCYYDYDYDYDLMILWLQELPNLRYVPFFVIATKLSSNFHKYIKYSDGYLVYFKALDLGGNMLVFIHTTFRAH